MAMRKPRNGLVMLAGGLGIVQGVTWAILCFMGILVYTKAWKPTYEGVPSYSDLVEMTIIITFLTPGPKGHYMKIVSPRHFFIWMIAYLIFSVIWVIDSGILLSSLKEQQHRKKYIKIWSSWTMMICASDFILTLLIGIDYGSYAKELQLDSTMAAGIIMTIVARGFVLWVVNATVAILLTLDKSEAPLNLYTEPNMINGFEPASPEGYNNPRYEYENPAFGRSNSSPTSENLPKLPPIASTNERLAKIVKPGGNRSPYSPNYPQKVSPPSVPYVYPTSTRVPSPDYSPPTSRRIPPQPPLKPALKTRPDYNNFGYNNRY